MNRKEFFAQSGTLLSSMMIGSAATAKLTPTMNKPSIEVKKVNANFEREPLYPYRFKGSAIAEAWQPAAYLESASGNSAIGLGTQSVLWSDATVFLNHSVSGGNARDQARNWCWRRARTAIDERQIIHRPCFAAR